MFVLKVSHNLSKQCAIFMAQLLLLRHDDCSTVQIGTHSHEVTEICAREVLSSGRELDKRGDCSKLCKKVELYAMSWMLCTQKPGADDGLKVSTKRSPCLAYRLDVNCGRNWIRGTKRPTAKKEISSHLFLRTSAFLLRWNITGKAIYGSLRETDDALLIVFDTVLGGKICQRLHK